MPIKKKKKKLLIFVYVCAFECIFFHPKNVGLEVIMNLFLGKLATYLAFRIRSLSQENITVVK